VDTSSNPQSSCGGKDMRTSSINAVKNKTPSPSLGEVLLPSLMNTIKGVFSGLLAIIIFICAPVWNSKERMKHLTHFLMFSLISLVLLWAFFWIGQRPVFTIGQIQIQGEAGQSLKHVNPALVRTQVLNQLGGNFFSIRLDHARKAFEDLPWVRSASVRRVWPNGLSVTLEEQQPIGIWNTKDGPKLLNSYGELFTVNLAEAELEKGLVEFSGPTNGNKEAVELYQQLGLWFKPMDTKVVSLSLSSRYSWTTRLDNGMVFELGRDLDQKDRSQIKNRLDRFFKVWPEVKETLPNKVDYIDLRYANGFAVRASNQSELNKKDLQTTAEQYGSSSLFSNIPNSRVNGGVTDITNKKNTQDLKKSKFDGGRKSE
jgi:cell division protein FtsQ